MLTFLAVTFILCKRGQLFQLTKSIQASLIFYLLQIATQLPLIKALEADIEDRLVESYAYRVSAILGQFFFLVNHWIFTWLYFSTACLFKLSFGEHSVESIRQLKKRKRCLTLASILAYSFFISICIYLVILAVKDQNIFNPYSNFYIYMTIAGAVFVFILTVLSLSAMRYI